MGQDGVECTACTATQTATGYLQFLPKKGALLRVTQVPVSKSPAVCSLVSHVLTMTHHVLHQDGDLQLWSLSTQKLIDSMPCADAVVSVAVMHSEPYVLLGCASGSVQVISLLSSSQDLAIGALEAQSMELQPYQGAKHTCFGTLLALLQQSSA